MVPISFMHVGPNPKQKLMGDLDFHAKLDEALSPIYPGMAVSEVYPLLISLREAVRAHVRLSGVLKVLQICDSFLRAEARSTSLSSLLVGFLSRHPTELGEVCGELLSLTTVDTVACGASRGKRTIIDINPPSVRFEIELGEFYDEWTGCRVWPGSLHLASAILSRGFDISGNDVLELGSGLGICGIACMKAGANSIAFTEYNQNMLDLCHSNAARNVSDAAADASSRFLLNWDGFNADSHAAFQEWRKTIASRDYVVIGSEIVYEEFHVDMVLNVLTELFRNGASRGLIVIMLKPSRPGVDNFLKALRALLPTSPFECTIEEQGGEDDQLAACIYLHRR